MKLRLILNFVESRLIQPTAMQINHHLHAHSDDSDSADAADPIVCRCLQVTESTVKDAIATWNLETVKEVCRYTEAGGGCTACHAMIRRHLCATAKRAAIR